MIDNEFLTVREVADVLDCSAATVRSYIHQGALPAEKVVNAWLIDPEDLEEFIEDLSDDEEEEPEADEDDDSDSESQVHSDDQPCWRPSCR